MSFTKTKLPERIAPKFMALASSAALALSLGGCAAVGGGNIPSANTPISQSEAQQGAEADPQLLAEFGGRMTGRHADYVEQVGKNIAVQSGLGGAREDFQVRLVNSSVNNAFAIPGGYIYTTRQLVALMNNEAELAAVLGHEVGHVAARHSQRRQAATQRNTLAGAGLAILSGVLLGDTGLGDTLSRGFLQGSQLLTLSFSRNQELEADRLGVQYLNSAGYDPRAMGMVLANLAAQNALDAQIQGRDATIPEWASTHPDPASRVQNALQMAQGTGILNRDTFLTNIDGLVYGDDPAQGVIEGQQFLHPDFRLKFTAPNGFYMVNGTRAVSINGQSGQAQLTTGQYNGNIEAYVRQVFATLGGQQQITPQSIQRTTINGIPAAYGSARVNAQGGATDLTVFAYEFGNNQAFHFQAVAPAGRTNVFGPMFNSMQRISQAEANAIIPRRLDIVTVGAGDTIRTLASRMAYPNAQEARFRVLNGLSSTDTVQAGQKVKIVVRSR